MFYESDIRGWRDAAELRALSALAEDLGSITNSHGNSQPSGDPAPSSDLHENKKCTRCTYIHTCRYNTHKMNKYKEESDLKMAYNFPA